MLVPPKIGNGFLVEGDSYKARKNLLLRHGTLFRKQGWCLGLASVDWLGRSKGLVTRAE